MENLFQTITTNPGYFRQLRSGDSLVAEYTCPIRDKFAGIWANHNYFVCVTEGKKIWHTPSGSYTLEKGSCAFVRKGASIVEQFFDTPFCLMLLFVTDEFITETIRSTLRNQNNERRMDSCPTVMQVQKSPPVDAFFHSMSVFFAHSRAPESPLLELKFRELILTVAGDPENAMLLSYFRGLSSDAHDLNLRRVMEENYRYNLSLDAFAALSNRSLSSFKRDFLKLFRITPGKWLQERRLEYARHLLANEAKTVGEAAFESGFENASHFSRAFKTRYGISPVAVRDRNPS